MRQAKRSRSRRDLSPVHPAAAAIDIGATMHVADMDRPFTKSRFSCLSLAPTAILAGSATSSSARLANAIVSPPDAAINLS